MAYPNDIPIVLSGYIDSANPTGIYGFEYNGNQYQFLTAEGFGTPTGDQKLHALKSTDNGETWVELDSAHAPHIAGQPSYGSGYAVMQDGATVYLPTLVVTDLGGSHFVVSALNIYTFDLAGELWHGPISTVNKPLPDFEYRGTDPSGLGSRETVLQLIRRGPGDYLMYYSGAPFFSGSLAYGRVWVVTFDGATFGTPVKVAGQADTVFGQTTMIYWGIGAVSDSTGRTWFVMIDNSTNDPAQPFVPHIIAVSMDVSGTFDTAQYMPPPGLYWSSTRGTVTPPVIYTPIGGVESVAFAGETTSTDFSVQHISFFSATSVANPTWTPQLVTTGVDNSTGSPLHSNHFQLPLPQFFDTIAQAISLSTKNCTLLLSWIVTDNNFNGAFYASQADTTALSWSPVFELFPTTGTFINGGDDASAIAVYSYPMANGIGIVGISMSGFTFAVSAQFYFVPTCPCGSSPPLSGPTNYIYST